MWQLAGWLQANSGGRINISIDRLYENRPPDQGWPVWMQQQIEKADIVLIVCSPLYKERFQKDDDVTGGGAGVNFEGAIITQVLYGAKMRNGKFFPVLSDGSDRNNIPIILQQWDNGHKFPSGNDRILKLIFNDNPKLLSEISEIVAATPPTAKNGELEKLIVETIIEVKYTQEYKSENTMLTPIQIIVRSFIVLSESSKIAIAKNLEIFEPPFAAMRPDDLDKAIFKQVKDKKLLHEMWEQINAVSPFENAKNPF